MCLQRRSPKNTSGFSLDARSHISAAAFGAAGQRCMALSVAIFVGESIKWLPELVERARKLKVRVGLAFVVNAAGPAAFSLSA